MREMRRKRRPVNVWSCTLSTGRCVDTIDKRHRLLVECHSISRCPDVSRGPIETNHFSISNSNDWEFENKQNKTNLNTNYFFFFFKSRNFVFCVFKIAIWFFCIVSLRIAKLGKLERKIADRVGGVCKWWTAWVIRQEARREDLSTPADEVSVMELAPNHRTTSTLWNWRVGGDGGGGVVVVVLAVVVVHQVDEQEEEEGDVGRAEERIGSEERWVI